MSENVFLIAKVLALRSKEELVFVDLDLLQSGKNETFVIDKDPKLIEMLKVGKIFYFYVSCNVLITQNGEAEDISYRKIIILYEKTTNCVGFAFANNGSYWLNPGNFVAPAEEDSKLIKQFLALFPNFQKHKKKVSKAIELIKTTQDTEVFDALLTLSPWVLDRLLNFKGATVSVVIAKQLVELALLGRNLSTN